MLPGWRTMKFRSGNTHQNNVASSGISDMAAKHYVKARRVPAKIPGETKENQ